MGARVGTTPGQKVGLTNGTVVRIKSGDVVACCVRFGLRTKVGATKGLMLKSIVVAVVSCSLKSQLGPVVVL